MKPIEYEVGDSVLLTLMVGRFGLIVEIENDDYYVQVKGDKVVKMNKNFILGKINETN